MRLTGRKRAGKGHSHKGLGLLSASSQAPTAFTAFSDPHDLNQILDHAVREINKIANIRSCGISLFDERGILKFAKGLGLSKRYQKEFNLRVSPKLTSDILDRRYPKISNDVLVDCRKNKFLCELMKREKIGKEIGIPIRVKNRLIGILNVGRDSSYPDFSERDLKLLTRFCNQIAVAIDHAKLHQELQNCCRTCGDLVEGAHDSIVAVDSKGYVTYCNRATEILTGYRREELIGKHFSRVGWTEQKDISQHRKLFKELLRGKKVARFEMKARRKDGNLYWIEVHVSEIKTKGRVTGIQANSIDITERKKIELELIRKEKIATGRAHLLQDLRNLDDIDQILTRVCQAVRDSGLFQRAVMTLHKPGGRIAHLGQVGLASNVVRRARQAPPIDDRLRARVMSRKFRISESFFIPAEAGLDFSKSGRHIPQKKRNSIGGDWQPGDELFVPLRDFSGQIMGYLSVDTPVGGCRPDLKTIQSLEMLVEAAAARVRELEAREALKRERDFSKSILETANSLVVCLDAGARIMVFNEECERVTGYRREEVLGERWPRLFLPSNERHTGLKSFARWVRAHPRDQYEGSIITKDGEIRTILWSNTALLGSAERDLVAIAIGQDITERKRGEEKLRESEETARALLNAPPDVALLADADGTIIALNEAAAKILGKGQKELVGRCVFDLFPREVAEYTKAQGRKVIRSGKPIRFEDERRGRWLDQSVYPIFNAQGKVGKLAIFGHDITERKRAEEALQVSQERYKLSTKAGNVGVWDWDVKTNRFYIDPVVKEILGYKDEEIPNDMEVWLTYVHPDDREPVMAAAKACLDGKTPEYVFEHRMLHKDGSVRWILSRGNVIRDQKENVVRMAGTDTDITERKRAREELQASESKYKTLLENLPQKVFLKNTKSVYLSCNENFARDLNIKAESIAGKTDYDFFPTELAEKYRADDKRIIRSGKTEEIEERYIQDEREVFVHTVKTPVKDEKGNLIGLLGIFWDITERKRADEALRKSEDQLRLITDALPVLISYVDSEQRYRFNNKAYEEWFGHSRRELRGKHLKEVLGASAYRSIERYVQTALSGQEVTFESAVPYKDGGIRYVNASYIPHFGEQGEVKGFFALVRDITEHKRVDEALRQSEKQYRTLVETAQEGIGITDPNENFTFVNRAFADMLGYKKEELLGRNLRHISEAQEFDKFTKETQKRKRGESSKYEARLLTKRRKSRYFYVSAVPIRAEKGKFQGTLGVLTDITELKKAREQNLLLETSRALSRTLNLDQVLKMATEKMAKALKADRCGVAFSDQNMQSVTVEHVYLEDGSPSPALFGSPLSFRDCYEAKESVRTKGHYQVLNSRTDAIPKSLRKYLLRVGVKSCLIVPMFVGKGLLGLVNIGSVKDLRNFTAEEIGLAQTIANQVAVAVQNALLIEDLRKKHSQIGEQSKVLERRYREQAILARISRELAKTLDLDRISQISVKETAQALQVDRCAVALAFPEEGYAEIKSIYVKEGKPPTRLLGHKLYGHNFPQAGEMFEKRKLINVPNIYQLPDGSFAKKYFSRERIKSALLTPMVHGKELVGFFVLSTTKGFKKFTKEESKLAQTIADQVAVAIANARLLELVKKSEEDVKALAAQLINVQEDKGKKIAGELHDEVGQTLFAMKMNLDVMKKNLPTDLEKLEDMESRLSDTENLLSQTIDYIRNLTTDLRPSMLDDFGLVPALKWYVDKFSRRTDIEVSIKTKNFKGRLSPEIETTFYRVIQEALTNVAKHAKATEVTILLGQEDFYLSLSVEDNGRGFDTKKITLPKDRLGLFSVKERVRLLKGEFKISSRPNKGTKLNVRIPLAERRV